MLVSLLSSNKYTNKFQNCQVLMLYDFIINLLLYLYFKYILCMYFFLYIGCYSILPENFKQCFSLISEQSRGSSNIENGNLISYLDRYSFQTLLFVLFLRYWLYHISQQKNSLSVNLLCLKGLMLQLNMPMVLKRYQNDCKFF